MTNLVYCMWAIDRPPPISQSTCVENRCIYHLCAIATMAVRFIREAIPYVRALGSGILAGGALPAFAIARDGHFGTFTVVFRPQPEDPQGGYYVRDYSAVDHGWLWDTVAFYIPSRGNPHEYERFVRPVKVLRYDARNSTGRGDPNNSPKPDDFDGKIVTEFSRE